MECPNCHHWNEASARFCEECGFELKSSASGTSNNPVPVPLSVLASRPTGDQSADTPVSASAEPESPISDPALIPDPAPQTLVPPEAPVIAPAYSGPHFILNSTGSIFKLGSITIIGREEPSAQIDLDGYPDGRYVSHRHAQVTNNSGTFYLEDLGSSNHTYVNGVKLSPGQSEPLHDGDLVRIGKIELRFQQK